MKLTTAIRIAFVSLNVLGMGLWVVGVEPIDWRRGALYECLGGGDMVAGGAIMILLAGAGFALDFAWLVYACLRARRRRWAEAITLAGVVVAWAVFFTALSLAIPRLPWC